jgi:hypothetical protein
MRERLVMDEAKLIRRSLGLSAFLVLFIPTSPAAADPNSGIIEICRLPFEHHKEFANVPRGSAFVQRYPIKVFQPAIGQQPARYVENLGSGYLVKTLDPVLVGPAPSCATVRAGVQLPEYGARLPRDVPPLAAGSTLAQQFNDPATSAQFKTKVLKGFR